MVSLVSAYSNILVLSNCALQKSNFAYWFYYTPLSEISGKKWKKLYLKKHFPRRAVFRSCCIILVAGFLTLLGISLLITEIHYFGRPFSKSYKSIPFSCSISSCTDLITCTL